MALTTKRIAKATEPGRYGDGKGLCLQVTPAGVRSWLLRYQRNGIERYMGLGPLSDFTIEEARERARRARQLLRDGIDPIDARIAERAKQATEEALAAAATVSFQECAEQYYRFHSPKWSNAKHAQQFTSTLAAYVFPVFGKLPVGAVDKALVLKAIDPIWHRIPETASRVRGRIEQVLDFAKTRGYRDGENPAAWDGNLKHALPARNDIAKVEHHAALPFADLPAFMTELHQRGGIAARALEFTILTGARTGEVLGAKWDDEIDFDAKLWTIPGERMKARKEHKVPLSERTIEILKALPRESDSNFVFIGGRAGAALSKTAMTEVLGRMGRSAITVHGFRSAFRDWCSERTSYPNDVVEMCLAHTIESKVERAYRRGDLLPKRARLMADWAKFCTTPAIEKTAANVTSIRRA